jgi:hypothetical protein
LYEIVYGLAEPSEDASDFGLVFNLWLVLNSELGVVRKAALEDRTKTLIDQLKRLSKNKHRPNNALEARATHLLVDLVTSLKQNNRKSVELTLQGLKSVLHAAKTLGRYPVEQLAKIIQEMGSIVKDISVYDELFEMVVSLLAGRKSDGGAGGVLMRGGYQKLQLGNTYQAIRLFGRAQEKLSKQEYLRELMSALVGCGLAYERAGLLWAARTNLLAATADATSEFRKQGALGLHALRYLRRLIWLELQLGRILPVLRLTVAADAMEADLKLDEETGEMIAKERETQDIVLGLLFLGASLSRLAELEALPDILERLGYHRSRLALLYALGHESVLREERWIPDMESENAAQEMFESWIRQPAKDDLPTEPELWTRPTISMRTIVLGCNLTITAANDLRSIQLGETVLCVIESVLATSLNEQVFPYRESLDISIETAKAVPELVAFDVVENRIRIRHDAERRPTTRKERSRFRNCLLELIAQILPRIAVFGDAKGYIDRIMGQERALSRALDFSEVSITLQNILGDMRGLRLADWTEESELRKFPLRRSEKWCAEEDLRSRNETVKANGKELRLGSGEPPPELLDTNHLKHRDMQILSLIDVPLWNRARWSATGFAWPQDAATVPPLLAICFKDKDAGTAIFQKWKEKLGNIDENDEIRISILTGIDRKRPFSYKVLVRANMNAAVEIGPWLAMVSRINRMDPPDSRNLEGFLHRFNRVKRYLISPGHYIDESTPPTLFPGLGIVKGLLSCRPVWQVGENDPDACALETDDQPIVPEGIADVPVFRALSRLKNFENEKKR